MSFACKWGAAGGMRGRGDRGQEGRKREEVKLSGARWRGSRQRQSCKAIVAHCNQCQQCGVLCARMLTLYAHLSCVQCLAL